MYASAAAIEPTPMSNTGMPRACTSGRPRRRVTAITATIAARTCATLSQPLAVARGMPTRLPRSARRTV